MLTARKAIESRVQQAMSDVSELKKLPPMPAVLQYQPRASSRLTRQATATGSTSKPQLFQSPDKGHSPGMMKMVSDMPSGGGRNYGTPITSPPLKSALAPVYAVSLLCLALL